MGNRTAIRFAAALLIAALAVFALGASTASAGKRESRTQHAGKGHQKHKPGTCKRKQRRARKQARRACTAGVSRLWERKSTRSPRGKGRKQKPAPEPAPAPEPDPVPAPEPAPDPDPAPEPDPVPTPEPDQVPTPSSASPIYWGAWIGDQLTGGQAPWDMSAVSKFEELAGKPLSLIHFSSPFANCASTCYNYNFPTGPMDFIRNHGSIPVFSWASQSIPSSKNEPDYQLSDVIAGSHDTYIRNFATAAKNWGHPFFLRFNWEMNGRWFPWSEGVNGNKSGEFVAAWRHVHDIFKSVGANNASWVWCPNVDPDNIFLDLKTQYPGDSYVDWTCLDGYNWGTNPVKPDRWRSFDELYRSTYERIVGSVAPSKPMLIGEMGSTEYGGSKASWIRDALTKVPMVYPQIRGLLWFEKYDDGMDWPIETSSSGISAFAAGIQNPAYLGNNFAGFNSSPIQPVD